MRRYLSQRFVVLVFATAALHCLADDSDGLLGPPNTVTFSWAISGVSSVGPNARPALPLGERNSLLLGIHNAGETPVSVSSVGASLHSALDYAWVDQNFSSLSLGAVVESHEMRTVAFPFSAHAFVKPNDYVLTAHVVFADEEEGDEWRHVFANATLDYVTSAGPWTIHAAVRTLLTLALGGAAAWALWSSGILSRDDKRKNKQKHVSRQDESSRESSSTDPSGELSASVKQQKALDSFLPDHLKQGKKSKKRRT